MRAAAILFLTSLLMAGCQTPITAENAAAIDLSKHGIVIVSVANTGESEDVAKVTVEYYLRSQNDRFRYSFVNSSKNLWVLTMSPGDYSVSDWYMVVGQQKRVSSETKYTFSVKAGTVTYIGRLQADVGRDKDLFGLKWVPKAVPRVRDMRDEDLSEFRKSFNLWSSLPIDHQVVDQFEWKDVETSRGTIPGT